MARYNTKATNPTLTTNLAGGEAFQQTPKVEFASILLTSFMQDQFYRSADETTQRLRELIPQVGYEFAAKAALFARDEFGMRSVTHVVAGELAMQAQGLPWTKDFYDRLVVRADDITEILSYVITAQGRGKVPHALSEGLGRALSRQNAYSLAKYRASGKAMSLVDAVNLCHPRSTEALDQLMQGTLPPAETWETGLSEAGQGEGDTEDLKAGVWGSLIRDGKLGALALLRNLRNLTSQADEETFALALGQLVDEERIRRSRIFPFQYQTAADALSKESGPRVRQAMEALQRAADIACENVPRFEGSTLVAVDVSGSMTSMSMRSQSTGDVAALFAAVIYRANADVDILKFDTQANFLTPRANDVLGIAAEVRTDMRGGGTDFRLPFLQAQRKYDRFIILSDMQGWVDYNSPAVVYEEYKRRLSANPHIYMFDLTGHGTMQLPVERVFLMAGFSAKVFDIMRLLEVDRNAMVNRIEQVALDVPEPVATPHAETRVVTP